MMIIRACGPKMKPAVVNNGALDNSLFIAASKSGTTTEAIDFMEYFYAEVQKAKG